jgi:hypothetical protein
MKNAPILRINARAFDEARIEILRELTGLTRDEGTPARAPDSPSEKAHAHADPYSAVIQTLALG